jgi:hypothetical protein
MAGGSRQPGRSVTSKVLAILSTAEIHELRKSNMAHLIKNYFPGGDTFRDTTSKFDYRFEEWKLQ